MSRDTIGDRIRRLRREKNVSQTMLANALGFNSAATVSAWENGKGQLTSEMIVGLCKYFRVSADFLLMGTEHVAPEQEKRVMLERITDIKVYDSTMWKGFWSTLLVLIATGVTMVVSFVGPSVHEWIKFGLTMAWLCVFLVFSLRQLLRPFRPDKVVYMTPGTSVLYRASATMKELGRRSGDMVALAVAESFVSVVAFVSVLLTSPSIRPVFVSDLVIIAASLVLILSWTHAAFIFRSRHIDIVVSAHDFNRQSRTDLDVIRLLLSGMLFVSGFIYGMLWLESDPRYLHAKAVFAIGSTSVLAILSYASKRWTTAMFHVEVTSDKSLM
jgi:transcriptional regulator with XRE-family HTH domain